MGIELTSIDVGGGGDMKNFSNKHSTKQQHTLPPSSLKSVIALGKNEWDQKTIGVVDWLRIEQ